MVHDFESMAHGQKAPFSPPLNTNVSVMFMGNVAEQFGSTSCLLDILRPVSPCYCVNTKWDNNNNCNKICFSSIRMTKNLQLKNFGKLVPHLTTVLKKHIGTGKSLETSRKSNPEINAKNKYNISPHFQIHPKLLKYRTTL